MSPAQGAVYTWGFGRGGRLGHPDFHIHSGEGAVISPRLVAGLGGVRIVSVAAAKHHSLAAADSGDVYSWGSNRDGRLGYGQVDKQSVPHKARRGAAGRPGGRALEPRLPAKPPSR